MKKLKTVLGLIVITVLSSVCLVLLYQIYNEEGEFVFFKDTTKISETGEGYDVLVDSEKFDSYFINREDMSFIELSINDAYVKFENEAIWIKDQLMIQGSQINRNFAVYDDCVLVIPFSYKYKLYGGIIIYNLYLDTYAVYEELDGLYIDIIDYDQTVYFTENGVSLSLSNVSGKFMLEGDKTKKICDYKKKKVKDVKRTVIFIYDENEKDFIDTEIITSLDYKSYINSNNYC